LANSIVVTGMGMVTPLGASPESTWKALMAGESAIRPLKGREWEAFDAPRAAQVLEGWTSQSLLRRDRSLQLGVLSAEKAWKTADLFRVAPGRIATTFSSSKGGLLSLLQLENDGVVDWDFLADFFPHAGGQLLAHRFGFSGTALSVASACSTGVGSLAMGARLLLDGECEAVLTGSTEASIHPLIYAGFNNMGLFSQRDRGPAPFDLERDGFLMGEGAATLILELEASARRRRAPIAARLAGWALGADAYKPLEMEPNGKSIVPVIQRALHMAGLKPGDIGYINAHGTGTRSNDRVESSALEEIFGNSRTWVSSTKGATGHLLGAARSVEAVLAAMVLEKGEIPDTRNLERPDPDCDLRHVEKGGVREKVAHVLSLSYGFGGQLGAVIFSKA